MKKVIVIIVILAVLVGVGFLFWNNGHKNTGSQFSVEEVSRGTVQAVVTATGELKAVTAVDVGSEVSGTIEKIFVEYNSEVKKGQLLAQINPETLQAQVDKAKANLSKSQSSYENAQANLKNSQAAVRKAQAELTSQEAAAVQAKIDVDNCKANCDSARSGIQSAQAALDKAAAEYANDKINYERSKSLYEQDLIARSECDNAYTSMVSSEAGVNSAKAGLESSYASLRSNEAKYNSALVNLGGANAKVEAARIQIESAQRQAEASEASVKGAKADVEQAKANLNSAEVDLGKTKITSPIDGVVLNIEVSEGQTVAAQYQAPKLFELAQNLNDMQVEATVDEADIGQIKAGNKATFTVDAWSDREFTGTVREVRKSATTTNNVVTFPVIIDTDNPDMCLMPGMTATIDIHTVSHENVLTVSSTALRFKPDKDVEIIDRIKPKKDSKPEDHHRDGEFQGPPPAREESLSSNERYVYIEDPRAPGALMRVKVKVGLADGSRTEVASENLNEGDKVVTGKIDPAAAAAAASKKNNRRRRGPGPF
ncbi:efflux RND transporter periplasmic adaptor subunit [bacterium]|nr:efflux RND transporter periplasmic adaptor subunit [bacterium]